MRTKFVLIFFINLISYCTAIVENCNDDLETFFHIFMDTTNGNKLSNNLLWGIASFIVNLKC